MARMTRGTRYDGRTYRDDAAKRPRQKAWPDFQFHSPQIPRRTRIADLRAWPSDSCWDSVSWGEEMPESGMHLRDDGLPYLYTPATTVHRWPFPFDQEPPPHSYFPKCHAKARIMADAVRPRMPPRSFTAPDYGYQPQPIARQSTYGHGRRSKFRIRFEPLLTRFGCKVVPDRLYERFLHRTRHYDLPVTGFSRFSGHRTSDHEDFDGDVWTDDTFPNTTPAPSSGFRAQEGWFGYNESKVRPPDVAVEHRSSPRMFHTPGNLDHVYSGPLPERLGRRSSLGERREYSWWPPSLHHASFAPATSEHATTFDGNKEGRFPYEQPYHVPHISQHRPSTGGYAPSFSRPSSRRDPSETSWVYEAEDLQAPSQPIKPSGQEMPLDERYVGCADNEHASRRRLDLEWALLRRLRAKVVQERKRIRLGEMLLRKRWLRVRAERSRYHRAWSFRPPRTFYRSPSRCSTVSTDSSGSDSSGAVSFVSGSSAGSSSPASPKTSLRRPSRSNSHLESSKDQVERYNSAWLNLPPLSKDPCPPRIPWPTPTLDQAPLTNIISPISDEHNTTTRQRQKQIWNQSLIIKYNVLSFLLPAFGFRLVVVHQTYDDGRAPTLSLAQREEEEEGDTEGLREQIKMDLKRWHSDHLMRFELSSEQEDLARDVIEAVIDLRRMFREGGN